MIRDGQQHRILNVLETGAKHGMCTLNQSLREQVIVKNITLDTALACSADPLGLDKLLGLTTARAE